MVRLWGIPRTVGEWFRRAGRRPLAQTLWVVFVSVVVLLAVAVLSFLIPVYGGIVAVIIGGAILGDEVRALVSDTYQRRWTRVDLSRLWPF